MCMLGECMLLKTFRMFKPVETYKCDGTMVVAVMVAAVAATMNNGTQAFGIAAAAAVAACATAILSSIANKMRDKCFKYTERQ